MTWDDVMEQAIVPLLEADTLLIEALGGAYIFAGQASRPVRVPSVEWLLVDDQLTEVFNPIEVQFDYWARSMSQGAVIERRLRTLMQKDTRRRIAGINLSTLYEDSFTHEYPEPGILHRSLRFRFEPVRTRQLAS